MTVCILGAGSVARALARGFSDLGHDVRLAARDPHDARHRAFSKSSGCPVTEYAGVAVEAGLVVLATAWEGAEDAVAEARIAPDTLVALGWDVADLGGVREARSIEAITVAWIRIAMTSGSRRHAFRLFRATS